MQIQETVGKPTMITRSDGEREKGQSRVNGRMMRLGIQQC